MLKKGMGSLRAKGKKQRLYVRFYYSGAQREEPLNLYCTGTGLADCKCRDHKAALAMMIEIDRKIEANMFDYRDYFPTSSALESLGLATVDKSITFATYATAWLEQQQLAYSTKKIYSSIIYAQLIPTFGAMALNAILPFHIRAFVSKLDKSPKYVKNIIGVLSVILNSALDDGVVEKNRCERIRTPKIEAVQVDPLTLDEAATIINYIGSRHADMALFFAVGFYMGLRTGEILGLKWGDFDFRNQKLTVQRTITKGKVKHSTKTADYRTIKIPPILDIYISTHKQFTFLKSEWVFLTYKGEHFTQLGGVSRNYWEPTLKALGIRYRQMYQMRHSFACNALLYGQDVPYVQSMLGHTTPQMIYRRYGNSIHKEQQGREGFDGGQTVKKYENKG